MTSSLYSALLKVFENIWNVTLQLADNCVEQNAKFIYIDMESSSKVKTTDNSKHAFFFFIQMQPGECLKIQFVQRYMKA